MRSIAKADGGTEALTVILEALTHRRRRYVLYYLHERSEPAEAEEIAKQILAWETDRDPDAVTTEEAEQVLADLYHNHLPRLADEGLIDYDRRTLTARSWKYHDLLSKVLQFLKSVENGIDS